MIPNTASPEEFSDTLIRAARLIKAFSHRSNRVVDGLEPALVPLLFQMSGGPCRISEIAGCLHSDISTISRQVATLVTLGLVAKTTDPDDRRAQRASLTDEGRKVTHQLRQLRQENFALFLADWTPEEVGAFHRDIARLAASVERHLAALDSTD